MKIPMVLTSHDQLGNMGRPLKRAVQRCAIGGARLAVASDLEAAAEGPEKSANLYRLEFGRAFVSNDLRRFFFPVLYRLEMIQ